MNALAALAINAQGLIPWVLLFSIRIGVAFASLPAPFGSGSPVVVRAALSFLVAGVVALGNPDCANGIVLDPFFLGFAALQELIVGAAIGLVGRGIVAAAETGGEIIAGSMGLGFAHVVDPNSGEQAMITSNLMGLLAMALLVGLDGHHSILLGLARSVELAPIGDALSGLSREGVVRSLAILFGAGLRIASPVVGVLFFVQLALGLVARAAPRLQVFGLSFAVATGVGLLTLHAAVPTAISTIANDIGELPMAVDAPSSGG